MEYIFISTNPNYTIVTGHKITSSGIETTPFDLANNFKALRLLDLVSDYARNGSASHGKDYAFRFFCFYLSEFTTDQTERAKKREILTSNLKIQILCGDELLTNLKTVLIN